MRAIEVGDKVTYHEGTARVVLLEGATALVHDERAAKGSRYKLVPARELVRA